MPISLSDGVQHIVAADELNTEYRADEQDNLRHLELEHPVIILDQTGLWNGSRTLASIVDFDNVGDIIADSPWPAWNTRHGKSTSTTT